VHHKVAVLYVVSFSYDISHYRGMLRQEGLVINFLPFKSFIEWSLLVKSLHVMPLRRIVLATFNLCLNDSRIARPSAPHAREAEVLEMEASNEV
jgi:hypothetical protein